MKPVIGKWYWVRLFKSSDNVYREKCVASTEDGKFVVGSWGSFHTVEESQVLCGASWFGWFGTRVVQLLSNS